MFGSVSVPVVSPVPSLGLHRIMMSKLFPPLLSTDFRLASASSKAQISMTTPPTPLSPSSQKRMIQPLKLQYHLLPSPSLPTLLLLLTISPPHHLSSSPPLLLTTTTSSKPVAATSQEADEVEEEECWGRGRFRSEWRCGSDRLKYRKRRTRFPE